MAVHCSALQCVAVCCSVLQCVAVRCSVRKYGNDTLNLVSQDQNKKKKSGPVLQCLALNRSVLQCVAVCCSALRCVAVRCSVSQCDNDPLHLVSQHQKKRKSETSPRLV